MLIFTVSITNGSETLGPFALPPAGDGVLVAFCSPPLRYEPLGDRDGDVCPCILNVSTSAQQKQVESIKALQYIAK